MVWETDNRGRQRWCTRLVQGGGFASPFFDGFDNLYIGQPGLVLSHPTTQWIRWRSQVIGMPMTARLLAPGALLVITHLGQVLVFDAQRGTVTGTSLDLVAGLDPSDSQRGLADCQAGGPGMPGGRRSCVLRDHRHGGAHAVGARRGQAGARRTSLPAGTDPAALPRVDQ